MTTHRISITAAVLALCTVHVAQAQRVGTAPRVSAVHLRSSSLRLTTTARVSGRSAAASAHSRAAVSPNNLFGGSGSLGLFGQFPGLGFSFGAANQDWLIKAAIDPATEWRLFEAQRFYRNGGFGAPGFYLLDGGAYYEVPAQPAEAEQGPQEQGPPAQTESAVGEPQPAAVESAPLEDVGEFVLVLRNGSRIEAVAFTRARDHIIYVTADGFRRTLALADLDPDATMRINEERGTPLQIPL